MYSPLEQFKIIPLVKYNSIWYDLSISNISLYIIISVILLLTILKTGFRINTSGYLNKTIEIIYNKYSVQILELGGTHTIPYIPLILSIFMYILINNTIGMVPYNLTTTGQISMSLTLSLTIIISITLLGIFKHSYRWIYLFIPSGVPMYILPLIFVIEIISYLSRIVSLSVRLTANIISGHTLLHIISSFCAYISSLSLFLFFFPLIGLFLIIGLEWGVAIIQAYVFSLLTLTYIHDTLNIGSGH